MVSRSDSLCLFFFLPENTKFTLLLGSFYSWRTTHNLIVSWKMAAKKANKKIIFLERTVGAVGPFHQLGLAPWQRTWREAASAHKIQPFSITCFHQLPSPTFQHISIYAFYIMLLHTVCRILSITCCLWNTFYHILSGCQKLWHAGPRLTRPIRARMPYNPGCKILKTVLLTQKNFKYCILSQKSKIWHFIGNNLKSPVKSFGANLLARPNHKIQWWPKTEKIK